MGGEGSMVAQALTDLWYGFGVALEPHNIVFCFIGVLVGNMVGVLPGMGPLATISILLPLTFGIMARTVSKSHSYAVDEAHRASMQSRWG